jgi:hypothetical protein
MLNFLENDKNSFMEVPSAGENQGFGGTFNPMDIMKFMNMGNSMNGMNSMNMMNPMNMLNQQNMMNPMNFMMQGFMMQMQFMQNMTMMQMQFMQSLMNMISMNPEAFKAEEQEAPKAPAGGQEGFKLGGFTIPPEILKKVMQMDMPPENLQKLQKVLDLTLGSIPAQKGAD